ncbi:MAG TPA: hypothetical protein VFV96_00730 [Verrucomicrobiae bacterium]|nr:hypothetical protein [Verrucomicrobiae bacterium]
MVITRNQFKRPRGMLEVDMLVAMALLFVALIPLAYSFTADRHAMRVAYERAVAMECLDGELELLAAGAWHNYPAGTNHLTLTGAATTNLSTRDALLILTPGKIRLAWRPAQRLSAGIIREVKRP